MADVRILAELQHAPDDVEPLADGRGVVFRHLRHGDLEPVHPLAHGRKTVEGIPDGADSLLHVAVLALLLPEYRLQRRALVVGQLSLLFQFVGENFALAADEAGGHAALLLHFMDKRADPGCQFGHDHQTLGLDRHLALVPDQGAGEPQRHDRGQHQDQRDAPPDLHVG